MNVLSLLPVALIEISAYLIIFICGFKMVRYVNLNTNLDGDLKRLNKLLTKVLIILVRYISIIYKSLSEKYFYL